MLSQCGRFPRSEQGRELWGVNRMLNRLIGHLDVKTSKSWGQRKCEIDRFSSIEGRTRCLIRVSTMTMSREKDEVRRSIL
jgi:hypothetical protein